MESLKGSIKEIAQAILVEGHYYIEELSSEVKSAIDIDNYQEGGFLINFIDSNCPVGLSGLIKFFPDREIRYDLVNKSTHISIKGSIDINDPSKEIEEAQLIIESILAQLFKIEERYSL
jgi:hypothetical protein